MNTLRHPLKTASLALVALAGFAALPQAFAASREGHTAGKLVIRVTD